MVRTFVSQTILRAQGNYPTTPHQLRRFWLIQHGKIPPDPPVTPTATDWRQFDSKLAEVYHWQPYQIDQMTLPEIYAALCPPHEANITEVQQQAQAYKKLSPEEKLDLARFLSECD